MLTDMEESYSKMINNKSTCKSIRQYMLNVLLSGLNPKFNAFIERIKNDIDSGIGFKNHMLHDDLVTAARAKYNNMVASGEYSKLDPKDANIIALTTKFTALERSVSENLANVISGGGSGGGYRWNQGDKIAGVERWRTINKCDTIQNERKTVWWCPSHKHKGGLFDGLYVWRKPEDHYAWFKKSKIRISKKDETTAATTAAPLAVSKQGSLDQLTVSQHLKEVFCYNLMLSDGDTHEYCKHLIKSKY